MHTLVPDFDLHWQMTNCERFALLEIVRKLSPEFCVEIGTYQGGSLQVLAEHSLRVVSIDIDQTVEQRLSSRFPNTEFIAGSSASLLPELVAKWNSDGTNVDLILVDGDHSELGVKRDIDSLLQLVPQRPTVIILHDSFNPDCRAGMLAASWSKCPYVHDVEIDFIPGVFHQYAFDTAEAGSMWGGFACAILQPTIRNTELTIFQSQSGLFEATLAASCYQTKPPEPKWWNFLSRGLQSD